MDIVEQVLWSRMQSPLAIWQKVLYLCLNVDPLWTFGAFPTLMSWSDSVVKLIFWSCRDCGYNSLYPYGDLQPSVTSGLSLSLLAPEGAPNMNIVYIHMFEVVGFAIQVILCWAALQPAYWLSNQSMFLSAKSSAWQWELWTIQILEMDYYFICISLISSAVSVHLGIIFLISPHNYLPFLNTVKHWILTSD